LSKDELAGLPEDVNFKLVVLLGDGTKLTPKHSVTTPPNVVVGQASLLNLQLVSKRNQVDWVPPESCPIDVAKCGGPFW